MIREGRLGKDFDKDVASFTSSLAFDEGLFEYDLLNNMAHLIMLSEQGIVKKEDAKKVLRVLKKLYEKGVQRIKIEPSMEDVHMAIEAAVIKEAGEVGGVLHSARSRNDQIACDLRMKTRTEANLLSKSLISLVISLLEVAETHTKTVMPAFTHMQHAQPTTLAHHLQSYVYSFIRCLDRLEEAYRRIDLCPLGAGAVTSTSFPIKRERTAELLGFKGLIENSMDAVSARDYMMETAFIASLISIDVSRIAEELIIWSTQEFSYIDLSDSFASTSSIMPQKKNPDVLEILRARTATVIGSLNTLLFMLRSLPQSYNRDLQEDKEPVFDAFDTLTAVLPAMTGLLSTMTINPEQMEAQITG